MKTKIALVIFVVAALVLAVVLINVNKQAVAQHQSDLEANLGLSNSWKKAEDKLEEQKQVNLMLTNDLAARTTDLTKLSNDLAQATESLTKSDAALKAAMEETAKRDTKIADLENQNEALDKQALDLKGSISKLEVQIADTQKKLSASEGDKAFLEKELQRMIAEKAELERQFNDLAVLKQQVHKLKEELNIARRLDWIRQGIFAMGDEKGAQKLLQTSSSGNVRPASTNNYNLNVEVKSDGSVQVIAPITNSPAVDPLSPIKQ